MTENDLTLTFVNVGYGEAILLQRGSFTALIDGGAGDPREYENSTTGRIRGIDYLRKGRSPIWICLWQRISTRTM